MATRTDLHLDFYSTTLPFCPQPWTCLLVMLALVATQQHNPLILLENNPKNTGVHFSQIMPRARFW